jgi:hypothetical protein
MRVHVSRWSGHPWNNSSSGQKAKDACGSLIQRTFRDFSNKMNDQWIVIDQNDWMTPSPEEEQALSHTNTTLLSSTIVELSGSMMMDASNVVLGLEISSKEQKLRKNIQVLFDNAADPMAHTFSLREVVEEISGSVAQSSELSVVFQSSACTALWLPMFRKLHRLLSKRQVHYEQAATALYTLVTMLELSSDPTNAVRTEFFNCSDSAKVLLETLRNFGKNLTSAEENIIGQVFALLSNEKHLTKTMLQASGTSNGKKNKRTINMVHMIELIMKRCTNESVLQHGRDLLSQSDESFVEISVVKNKKNVRQPLQAVMNVDKNCFN